ncbi:hypothetical protein HPT27_01980 [Permianibacter sp. IMCC34836]|uniref:cytochrome c3 family protein n=1 Tax=Permianibacter fluminis TaxID=2738515 RepID=UPI001555BF2B|nr:cytochrome c3 family protein [Permianibacter fluminis]NQD35771.1 hypothetical protein [Permianibacter fluminis]
MTAPTEKDRGAFWRPSSQYLCGHLPCGKPCQQGPDAQGQCQTSTECIPAKRGARWHCTRAASAGGPCSDGPTPQGSCAHGLPRCSPIRSPRRRYRQMIAGLFVLALGVTLLIFALAPAKGLSPGPLSAKHAAGTAGCESCHQLDGSASVMAVVAGAFSHHPNEQQCFDCHTDKASPHSAHDGAFTAAATENPSATKNLMCRECHQEHDAPLLPGRSKQMAVCNDCHQQRQHAFPDHSRFADYPYQRVNQLRFDHRSHLEKHFPAKQVAGQPKVSCVSCHSATDDGRFMQVNRFADACASCHQKSLTAEPLLLLALPTLDLPALQRAGVDTSGWPEEGDDVVFANASLLSIANLSDGKIPALQLLNQDVSDLSAASPAQIKLVAQVSSAIRRSLHALNAEALPAAAVTDNPVIDKSDLDKNKLAQLRSALAELPQKNRHLSDTQLAVTPESHGAAALTLLLQPRPDLPAASFPKPCSSCHAPMAAPGQQAGWQSPLRSVKAGSTVIFGHRQHLLSMGDSGCQSCHRYNESDGDNEPGSDKSQKTPTAMHSFATIPVSTCASCHDGKTDAGNCSSCHQYHIGTAAPIAAEETP